jgi:hypothetical protein
MWLGGPGEGVKPVGWHAGAKAERAPPMRSIACSNSTMSYGDRPVDEFAIGIVVARQLAQRRDLFCPCGKAYRPERTAWRWHSFFRVIWING